MSRFLLSTLALTLAPLALGCSGSSDDGSTGTDSSGTDATSGTTAPTTGSPTSDSATGTTTSTATDTATNTATATDSGSATSTSTGGSTGSTGGTTGGNVPPCPYTEVGGMPSVTVEEVAGGFTRPVIAVGHPEQPDRLVVVEQAGRIKILEPNENQAPNDDWLDITSQVDDSGNEMGLLGFAFHPDYPTDARIYVSYNSAGGTRRSRISEFMVGANEVIDTNSERTILELHQPASNHNGGMITFGPDGYLYIGMGDGGNSCDNAADASRDTDVLLSKILRIDVEPDGTEDNPEACASCQSFGPFDYTIPADNPFVNDNNFANEIFAWGFRNPWRFSFDIMTGRLYVGDVGQDAWEEIDVVEAGKDHGWVTMEGNHCSQGTNCGGPACDTSASPGGENNAGMVAPIAEYSHQATNGCSITGGAVYRSCQVPGWDGVYFYSDYCDGNIRALVWDGSTVNDMGVVGNIPELPSGNGWNAWGDVYFVTQGSFQNPVGGVWRIVPQ